MQQQPLRHYTKISHHHPLCLSAGNEASTTMFYTAAAIVGVVPPLDGPARAQATEKAAQVRIQYMGMGI
jgi:hypothetical protein